MGTLLPRGAILAWSVLVGRGFSGVSFTYSKGSYSVRMQRRTLSGLFVLALAAQPAWAEDAPTGTSSTATQPGPTTPAGGQQQAQAAKAPGIEVTWDKDPYYSDVDVNIPLTDKPIPTIRSDSEAVIYRDLIEGSFVPRYMLLEASAYPMPILGTY